MKISFLKIFVIISLTTVFNCSSSKENQSQEIRFVDLQGNPKSIKTRVPEANARIMSGQATNANEYPVSKKNFVEAPSYYGNNSANQKNIVSPKFSDGDNFKNAPTINYKDETTSSSEEKNRVENSSDEPVVEYDLSKDDGNANNNSKKKNFAQKETIESDDMDSNSSSKVSSINSRQQSIEEDEFVESSSKNTNLKNKIASNKKIKKLSNQRKAKAVAVVQSENDGEVEYTEESSQKIYRGGGGRIYVQVGSFFTSKGAKERLILTKEFGKGKVLVAYNKDNKRIYRSVYGPFRTKNSAINFRDKIIESGNEAIIIRGK